MPTDVEVSVDTLVGPLLGRSDGRIVRFGGVPYARAGRLQTAEPTRWTEPLDATSRGAAPPQVVGGLDLVPGMIPSRQSEDCLTAEIWTPSLEGRQPVLVWVPGGSYRIGGASLSTYDGTRLAEQSTVVVGVNYRLGALGWLAADGIPSNLGLRDLLAALVWVREVAPSFGGDPDRIVVMGESAGAGMIAHLLAAMPKLASRAPAISGAILQSGAPAGTLDAPTAAWVGEQVLDAAGVRDAAALRSVPLATILDAQERTVSAALGKVGMMPFHPWIDGDLLDEPAFRAPLAGVPLVVGTNANEMELFRDQVPALPEELAMTFLARKASSLGITDEARVRAALHACNGDLVEAVADLDLHVPNELMARAHEQRGHSVWRYRFDWQAPVRGACHALDLPFTFGTLDVDGWRDFAGAHDPTADALSLRMRTAWTSFARTGEPVDDVVGAWPQRGVVHMGGEPSGADDDEVAHRVGIWLGDAGAS
jgi:para-nitrobenzyl esterase